MFSNFKAYTFSYNLIVILLSRFKVSGNPCDDHNLLSIAWKKKTLSQLFLYFSVQIETENYKLIYKSQFRHFINWGKICITFGTFYDQLWASTSKGHKIFQLFWLQLVRMKSSKKKPWHNCWLRFYFLRYWPILHFFFLWNPS